jgi:hypothetical protein
LPVSPSIRIIVHVPDVVASALKPGHVVLSLSAVGGIFVLVAEDILVGLSGKLSRYFV